MQTIITFLKEYHTGLALAATWIGILIVAIRKRLHWRRKMFLSQVNFSLNYAAGGQLMMRTLLETTAEKVWLNDYGVKLVGAAAQKTTVDSPFICLQDAKDQDFVNRAVLNVLSELFADVFVACSLGVAVKTGNYCFALTCEKYDEMRTLKLRVLLIEEQALESLFGAGGQGMSLQVSQPHHRVRLNTLKMIHDVHIKEKGAAHHTLGYLELGVVP